MNNEPYSVEVLKECIDLQLKKSNDYQNPNSNIKQADHYPRGVATIADMAWQKMIRIYSLMQAAEENPEASVNFESLGDSARDAINYLSFFVSYLDEQMDGLKIGRDMFNRPIQNQTTTARSEP